MTDDPDFEAHLGALRERFQRGLPAYRDRLAALRNTLATEPSEGAVAQLRGVAHELLGSAAMFGFEEIGDQAESLQAAADQVLAGSEPIAALFAPLRQLLREVELAG